MYDLPNWIEEKIGKPETDNDLQQAAVARIFVEENARPDSEQRPYLTRRQVEAELDGVYSKGTVNDRLSELVEVDVLDTDELSGGNIYWLANEKSEWPIPPDVQVEPVENEMTVSEFFNEDSVTWGVVGVGVVLLSSFLIWIGGYLGAYDITFFGVTSQLVIAGAMLGMFAGWMVGGYGLFLWLRNSSTNED